MKLPRWIPRRTDRTSTRRRPLANLACQPLEQRLLLAVDVVGESALVNDLVHQVQTTAGSTAAVAVSDSSRVVVFAGNGLEDDHGIYAKLYDADGALVGEGDFLVNTTRAGEQHSAAVAMDADGNFVVAWAGRGVGDKHGIFIQRFEADGTALGAETLVNTTIGGTQTDPAIAMADDGSFTVGWSGQSTSDAAGVYLQRFTAAGEKLGGEVVVNTTTDDYQQGLALVYDAERNLVAAWSSLDQDGSDWGVYGQRFDAEGNRLGDEFAWNATNADSQRDVTLAAGPEGQILAAWESRGQDGDSWGVVARMLDSDGGTLGDEVLLNDQTAGQQYDVRVAIAADGTWIATWTTGTDDGAGWEVAARTFSATGTPEADSFLVNTNSSGSDSGHQHHAAVATAGDTAWVVWSGAGPSDRSGVYRQGFSTGEIDNGTQAAPNLAPIADTTATVGEELEVTVTATDPNPLDELTFQLDADNSPAGATIEKTGSGTAVIRWTPAAEDEGALVSFRVIVLDNGDPVLTDVEDFSVQVGNVPLAIDLNGEDVAQSDLSAVFAPGSGPSVIVDEALRIVGATSGMVQAGTVVLAATPDGEAETLSADTTGTSITAAYDPATRTLTLSGADTVANYEQVLRTLAYDNSSAEAEGQRTIAISVTDATETSNTANLTLNIGSIDLAALAQALTDADAEFYGAAWCPFCTEQKELFEDGGQLLPFNEVTDEDRMIQQSFQTLGITTLPTWIFSDGTRLEGVQSLQVLAAAAGVTLPVSETPFLAEIPDDTLLVGSPLLVPLDGYDPNGEPLTYEITTNNAGVTAELLTGNRSMRVDVAGYGDMVFQLFEDLAPRPADRVIDLAMEEFYDGVIFHRVVDGFAVQGGDPTGTGSGGSMKGTFDDQFNVDLQHNRAGLLSFAKGADDTNNSQFFITDGESPSLRNLDFNHSIFGIQVEGNANREAISDIKVVQQPGGTEISRPAFDVVMENVEIFTDTENAVMLLKAAAGVSGPVEVTVKVTNAAGNSVERTFTVEVADDTFNGRPFLGDIPPVTIEQDTTAEIQLTSTDVELDPVFYNAVKLGDVDYTFDISEEGLVSVTPPAGFTGEMRIGVTVGRSTTASDFDAQVITIQVVAP